MADKKAVTGGSEPSTQPVVELLTSILNEVQKQVLTKTPKPLEGQALIAVEQFTEIGAALALQPRPKITLTADPTQLGANGGPVKLTWSSTDAETVLLEKQERGGVLQKVADLTPAAGGSIVVSVLITTTFTATAKGPCGSATASATVDVFVVP